MQRRFATVVRRVGHWASQKRMGVQFAYPFLWRLSFDVAIDWFFKSFSVLWYLYMARHLVNLHVWITCKVRHLSIHPIVQFTRILTTAMWFYIVRLASICATFDSSNCATNQLDCHCGSPQLVLTTNNLAPVMPSTDVVYQRHVRCSTTPVVQIASELPAW